MDIKDFDLNEIEPNNNNHTESVSDDEIDAILASVNNKITANDESDDSLPTESDENDEIAQASDVSDEADISDDASEGSTNEVSESEKFEINIQYEDDEYDEALEDEEYDQEPKRRRRKVVQGANNSVFGGLLLIIIILCLSGLIALTGITVGKDILGFGDSSNTITINIPEGSTHNEIAQILHDEGIIQFTDVFMFIVKLSDGNTMYPGDIELSSNMSYEAIINRLCTMREEKPVAKITFPEGIRLYEAAQLLEQNGVCSAADFIYTFNNTVYGYDFEDMVESNKLEFYKMEGYLFPDTYEFYLGDSAYNVAKKFKANFASKVNYNMLDRANQLGYSLDELITLASIVQMEAGEKSEMKMVASVFINRLNNTAEFPRLQSDTTDNYVNEIIKPNSSIAYQEMYDAYDTYIGLGLPPGPICNPGIEAIEAVLYPEQTDYYYFCSNIETREFFYAKTLAEHNENLKLANLA